MGEGFAVQSMRCYKNINTTCKEDCIAYSKVALPLKAPNTENGAEFLNTAETNCWELYHQNLLAVSSHSTSRNLATIANSSGQNG